MNKVVKLKFVEPVLFNFEVSRVDLKQAKLAVPDKRFIARKLADFLIENGFIFSHSPEVMMDRDAYIFRFGIYAHRKAIDLP
jgi:hypothetical protein